MINENIEKMNRLFSIVDRLVALVRDANNEGVFNPSKNDDPTQADIKEKIRIIAAELNDILPAKSI